MIDPDALYTVEQAARKLMEVDKSLTFEQAYQKVCDAIDRGELKVAAYLRH